MIHGLLTLLYQLNLEIGKSKIQNLKLSALISHDNEEQYEISR